MLAAAASGVARTVPQAAITKFAIQRLDKRRKLGVIMPAICAPFAYHDHRRWATNKLLLGADILKGECETLGVHDAAVLFGVHALA